jgi:hypothetical protein
VGIRTFTGTLLAAFVAAASVLGFASASADGGMLQNASLEQWDAAAAGRHLLRHRPIGRLCVEGRVLEPVPAERVDVRSLDHPQLVGTKAR